jgi:hypothetical protein
MLSKCANPGCPAPFLFLHQGKLFRLDTNTEVPASDATPEMKKLARRIEFFWLCNQEGGRRHRYTAVREPKTRSVGLVA